MFSGLVKTWNFVLLELYEPCLQNVYVWLQGEHHTYVPKI